MNTAPHEGSRSRKGIHTGKNAILTLVLAMVLIASAGLLIGIDEESDADDYGFCGLNLTYTYTDSDKTLTIAGTGEMFNFSSMSPWYPYRTNIQTITIGSGVTSIGKNAFDGCSGITGLAIPNSVASIGDYAFRDCVNLLQISFGTGLTSIGTNPFSSHAFYENDGTTPLEKTADNLKNRIFAGTTNDKMIRLTNWDSADSLPGTAGNLYLTQDVTLTSTWNVPDGTTNLCLNGHSITMGGADAFISIGTEKTLNLFNCIQNSGVITHGANQGVGVNNIGTFNMYGGTISGNSTTANGGGVNNTGTFNMYGGTISDNSAVNGGGVNNIGTFNMYGGTISGNSAATDGGGVNNTGTLSIQGSITISNNFKTGKPSTSSNVYLPGDKKITTSGALAEGANIGIYVENLGVFTTGYKVHNTADPSDFFNSDNVSYSVSWNDGQTEAELVNGSQEEFTVKFDVQGKLSTGSQPADQKIQLGGKVTSPEGLGITNLDFGGWFKEPGCTNQWDFDSDIVTADITLYAKWTGTGSCGDSVSWNYDGCQKKLTISGTGAMADYNYEADIPWAGIRSVVTSIAVEAGVTSIGKFAFFGCTELVNVTMSDSLGHIGERAFFGCSELTTINIPQSLTDVGAGPFANCAKLTSITVSKGNAVFESVDGVLFYEKDSTRKLIQYSNGLSGKEYMISGTVSAIGAYAFAFSSSLVTVSVPESVKTIDNNAFESCVNLKDVVFASNCKIDDPADGEGHSVFKGCTSLNSGEILHHFNSYIRDYMFEGCGFTYVYIPSHFTKIGHYALNNPKLSIEFDAAGWGINYIAPDAFKTDVFMNADERIDFMDLNHRYFRGQIYIYQDDAYRCIGTVEYNVQGHGVAPEKQWAVILGYKAPKPADPATAGYIFKGWFKESECINRWYFDTDVTTEKNTILYAKWEVVKHKVTYDADGGSMDAPTQDDVAEGEVFEVADYSGIKSGYVFGGWTCGDRTYQPGDKVTMGTSDMVLKAKWYVPIKYTVSISAGEGGTVSRSSVIVDSGTAIVSAMNMLRIGTETVIATPNDGYEFRFWTGVTSSTVTSDMSITAKFSNQGEMTWAISYSLGGGSWRSGYVAPTQYAEGVGMPLPQSFDIVPYKKDGYTVSFLGWYLTGDESKTVVTSVKPTDSGNKSFTALWGETANSYAYTVNYQDAAGKSIAPSYKGTAEFRTKVTPEIISIPGYVPPEKTKTITISSDENRNTVTYVYTAISFTITISSGDHGTITGPTTVEQGSDAIFAITGDDDYIISDVTVDGESVGKKGIYTFSSVTSDHSISAVFEYRKDAKTDIDDVGNVIETYTEEQDGKDVGVVIRYDANGKTESYATVSVSDDARATVSVMTDSKGKAVVGTTAMIQRDATATITSEDLNGLREASVTAAKSLDVAAVDKMDIIVDSTTEAGTARGASISFEGVSGGNTLAITVLGDAGSISFDSKVIETTLKSASVFIIVFEEADDSSITPEQRKAAEGNAIYDVYATVNGKTMTTFDGEVKMSMPYELKEGESATSVKIYYVNDEGNVELIGGNWSNGYVTAKLSHFSDYFAAADYELRNVTLEQTGEGSVEASTYSCSPGTTVKLTATPAGGWKLAKWESQQVTVNDGSFVMPDEDVTVKAVFEKAPRSSSGFDWWWIPIIIVAIACIAGGIWFYNSRKA